MNESQDLLKKSSKTREVYKSFTIVRSELGCLVQKYIIAI